MAEQPRIVTGLGKAELHRILVRGYDLNKELVGKISFTDMTSLILRGRLPTANEARMLDALLVILVEHGMVSRHRRTAHLSLRARGDASRGSSRALRCRQRSSRVIGVVGQNVSRSAPARSRAR